MATAVPGCQLDWVLLEVFPSPNDSMALHPGAAAPAPRTGALAAAAGQGVAGEPPAVLAAMGTLQLSRGWGTKPLCAGSCPADGLQDV